MGYKSVADQNMVLEKICRAKKTTKELSAELSDRNTHSEQTPLNIDETNSVPGNEYIRGMDRRNQILECICIIESEQRDKTSLYIGGYEQTAVVSIDAAVIPLEPLIPDIHEKIQMAREQPIRIAQDNLNELNLTEDESIAIRLYTMQWDNSENSLYWLLNNSLRTANGREQIVPWFGYLKLVLMGLMKLPSENQTIWRGVTNYFKMIFLVKSENAAYRLFANKTFANRTFAIGESTRGVLAKLQWTFANWRNSTRCIGERTVDSRQL